VIKQVNMIECGDWDALVSKTYGRPYCFQQQYDCQPRGTFPLTVPEEADDFENTTLPEEVNHSEQGVSFAAWLARDPAQKLDTDDKWDREEGLSLWWYRNFYPTIQMVANDLNAKGLLPAGDYVINIDW